MVIVTQARVRYFLPPAGMMIPLLCGLGGKDDDDALLLLLLLMVCIHCNSLARSMRKPA